MKKKIFGFLTIAALVAGIAYTTVSNELADPPMGGRAYDGGTVTDPTVDPTL